MKDNQFPLTKISSSDIAGALFSPLLPLMWPVFTFAFQPIVDTAARTILSHKALIRGGNNESAEEVLRQVPFEDAHGFDEGARQYTVYLAARFGARCHISLNFLPRSVETSDAPIRST